MRDVGFGFSSASRKTIRRGHFSIQVQTAVLEKAGAGRERKLAGLALLDNCGLSSCLEPPVDHVVTACHRVTEDPVASHGYTFTPRIIGPLLGYQRFPHPPTEVVAAPERAAVLLGLC